MEAYCLYCCDKRKMKNAKAVTMKNGYVAIHGVCPTCGATIFRIKRVKRDSAPMLPSSVT